MKSSCTDTYQQHSVWKKKTPSEEAQKEAEEQRLFEREIARVGVQADAREKLRAMQNKHTLLSQRKKERKNGSAETHIAHCRQSYLERGLLIRKRYFSQNRKELMQCRGWSIVRCSVGEERESVHCEKKTLNYSQR